MNIPIHTKEDYVKMRIAGQATKNLLDEIESIIKPGISTKMIDDFAKKYIEKHNLKSACYLYKGIGKIPFPGYVCTSINHVICHGIPSEKIILKEGDIVGVDVTLIVDGYHGDSCRTFKVGEIAKEVNALVEITKQAMEIGIKEAYENNFIGNIGYAIQNFIESQPQKYSIVEEYCGHGIGKKFHQAPEIQHVGKKNTGPIIKEGMFFTIEPMVNLGTKQTRLLNDYWTVITKDYKFSAQFEHTIGITSNGTEIFTL